MKHAARKWRFPVKPSYWAVACALACPPAWAAVEGAYPNVPLSMTGGKSQIKPNVLLFVDTSGSMAFTIKDSKSTQMLSDGHPDARGTIAKAAAIEAIENNPHLRWGLATFTGDVGGATIVKQIQDPTNAHIDDLKKIINGLQWRGPTPTTSAYYELLRYYRGEELHHSTNRHLNGKYQSPIEYRCQKNLLVYISDGQPDGSNRQFYHFNSGFVRDMPNTSYATLARILRNDNTFGPIATGRLNEWEQRSRDSQCYAGRYYAGRWWEDSRGCMPVSMSGCADTGSCNMYSEFGIAGFSAIAHNQDMVTGKSDKENISFDDPQFRKQTIDTYTIGLGEDIRVLQNAARRGGGEYFPALSREDLKDALNKIVVNATVASIPFTGVTPSISSKKPNGPINAAETLSLNTEDWSSQLRFYQVDEKTGAISPGQYSLPTYNPAQSVSVISTENGPRYLNAGNSGGSVSGLSNDTFGLADADQNAWRKLASWLTREGAADDPAWGYRVRKHSDKDNHNRYLGDSLGNLVAMGVAGSERKYLAVGSNDGMVHIFKKQDGSTAANAYTDVFQYIPGMAKQSGKTLNARLVETAQEGYGGAKHINLVNGQISWYETSPTNGRTRIFMAGTLGEGGRAAYALNIAGSNNGGKGIGLDGDKAKWLKGSGSGEGDKGQADYFGVPLWDTSSAQIGEAHAADAEIGHLFGEPFNGRLARTGSTAAKASSYAGTNDIFYATVLGSGFNPPSIGSDADGKLTYPAPSVYVLDSLGLEAGKSASNTVNNQSAPGRLVKRISVGGLADNIKTDAPRGMTAVTGLDIDDDGVFDVAYAGDQNGNVYRFDFRAGVANWNAEIIFKGTEAQPITAAPEVYRNPKNKRVTVLFGTGSELYASNLHETGTQRLYGIHDALTDKAEAGGEVTPLTPSSSELAQRSFTQTTVNGKTIRTLNENSRGRLTDTQRGWVMELNAAQNGERVVDKPGLGGSKSKGGTVIFSTTVFQPPAQAVKQSCTATGATQTSGFIMTLDAESGSRPVALRIMKDNLDHIGEYRSGNLASIKVQSTGFERNIFGSSSSGKATELGSAVPERRTRCEAPVGSSEKGVEVLKFYCPTAVKRLSWREIF